MSAELFTPERIRHLRMAGDTRYPMDFSPVSTSSPLSMRVRTPRREISIISYNSLSSDSSGNITERAIQGIEDSIIIEGDRSKVGNIESDVSVHTAIEYVDSFIFESYTKLEAISRTEINAALKECALRDFEETPENAQLFAVIATERILWERVRIWNGTLMHGHKDTALKKLTKTGFDDYYIRRAVSFCIDKFDSISESRNFNRRKVYSHFKEEGCPTRILNQVFENSSVRKTRGESLSIQEMAQFIFAYYGPDDVQSFEYWFRIIGTTERGTLCFRQLEIYYTQILEFLKEFKVEGLPFASIVEQFCDMLGTNEWTLAAFKKNPTISYRVLNAFTNGREFFSNETDERMNQNRLDDDRFGAERTIWKRNLDRIYDAFYDENSSSFNENGIDEVAVLE